MNDLAGRVTKLSVPTREWNTLMEALHGAQALAELVLRLSHDSDASSNLLPSSQAADCKGLRCITLLAAQRPYQRGTMVQVSVLIVRDFIQSSIHVVTHRKMRLVLDMVQWDEQEDLTLSSPKVILEPYCVSIESLY